MSERVLKGIYHQIVFPDYPDFAIIELNDLTAGSKFKYCVVHDKTTVEQAHTNWFAEFNRQLPDKEIYECILLPAVALIEGVCLPTPKILKLKLERSDDCAK